MRPPLSFEIQSKGSHFDEVLLDPQPNVLLPSSEQPQGQGQHGVFWTAPVNVLTMQFEMKTRLSRQIIFGNPGGKEHNWFGGKSQDSLIPLHAEVAFNMWVCGVSEEELLLCCVARTHFLLGSNLCYSRHICVQPNDSHDSRMEVALETFLSQLSHLQLQRLRPRRVGFKVSHVKD